MCVCVCVCVGGGGGGGGGGGDVSDVKPTSKLNLVIYSPHSLEAATIVSSRNFTKIRFERAERRAL